MYILKLTKKHAVDYWNFRLQALQQNPEAFISTYEDAKSKVNPIQEVADRLTDLNNYTYGAFVQGQLVGSVTMARRPQQKFNHKADILAMYVSKNARMGGIGKQLLHLALSDAKAIGIEQLQLSVVSNNYPAKKLYEQIGFTTYGVEKQAIKYNNTYLDENLMQLFVQEFI